MVNEQFEQFGGSYLISDKNYEQYINGSTEIGRPDGQFMIPSNQMDDLLKNNPNNPREWEKQLGLDKNSLGDSNIHRVDVHRPQDYEPRLPNSDLSGANDKFIPGGKTPGGQDECVINQFPNPESNSEVGKISRADIEQSTNQSNSHVNSQTNNSTDKISDGGGTRAPNGTTPDQVPNKPFDPCIDSGATNGMNGNEGAPEAVRNATNNAQNAVTGQTGISV